MAGSERLREFLARITYQVDSTSERRFDDSLERGTKSVLKLGATLVATATAISFATAKIASDFEKLFYQTERTGASAKNIRSFGYAISQTGGSVESAQQSLEGFASFIRSNPGAMKFINGLGVSTTAPGGGLRDTVEILGELGEKLKAMPYFQQLQYAKFLGIDEPTLMAMNRGLSDFQKQYSDMAKSVGFDADVTAKKSVAFMQDLRELLAVLGLLKDKVFSDLQDKLGPQLDRLSKYILENLPEISTNIENLAISLFGLGESMFHVAKAFAQLKGGKVSDSLATAATGTKDEKAFKMLFSGGGMAPRWMSQLQEYASTHGARALGLRQNNPGNLRSWGDNPVENGFAKFSTPEAGLSAMAGNLMHYNARGYDTLDEIISHWAPSSENDTGAYVGALSRKLGIKGSDRMDLSDPGVMSELMQAMIQHEQGSSPFSILDIMGGITARLGADGAGAGGPTIYQTTNIDVNGAGDPISVGREVVNGQGRVNQDIARNMRGPIR